MPTVATKELAALVETGEFERLVIVQSHTIWKLFVITTEGKTLIHANKNGQHKEYRHAWQAAEWVADRFGISEVKVEHRPWQQRS